jgi:hypothetical protein
MTDRNTPDSITRAACQWLLAGAKAGSYQGPDPGPDHELSPLLAREFRGNDSRLPASARWFHLEQTVRPVLRRIHEEGLMVWAFKGFDLARSVYPFPGGRIMRDADLFTTTEDTPGILDAFKRSGWVCRTPGDGVLQSGIVSEVKAFRHGAMAELHTHIFYFPATFPGRLPDDLFENGRHLEPGLMGFAWHNALLMVLLHMITNPWIRPIWWADACLLAGKTDEAGTWKPFTRNALQTRLGNAVASPLETAATLGAPVPPRVTLMLKTGETRHHAILEATKTRRRVPTLLNLQHLSGWKRISWFHAMLWLVMTRQSPLRENRPE